MVQIRRAIESSWFARYSLAILLAGAALGVQLWIRPMIGASHQSFFAAVAISALLCGRASLLTLALCTLSKHSFFLSPEGVFALPGPPEAIRLVMFVALGLLVCWMGGSLRASERLLAAALTSIGDAVVRTDSAGRVAFMNPVAERLAGWSERAARGKPIEEVFPLAGEETGDPVENPVARVLREHKIVHLANHTVLKARDGRIVHVEDSAAPIEDAAGRRRGAILCLRDVTERKHAEREMLQSASLIRAVVESTTDAVFVKDLEGRYLLLNTPGLRQIGKTAEEVLGKDDTALFSGESGRQVMARDREVIASGVVQTFEEEAVIDGSRRVYHSTKGVFRDAQGSPAGLFGIARDVTERKRLEEHLSRAAKLESLNRMAAGVCHDFNNLLTVILGYGEVLAGGLSGGPHAEAAEEICAAARRASNLTGQLLAYTGRQMISPAVLDLNREVARARFLLERLAGDLVELNVALAPGLTNVRIDAGQFSQILVNLVTNARDAMPRGGRLRVRTDEVDLEWLDTPALRHIPAGSYAVLSVSDSGMGMDEETKARIFEPFFTTKEVGKGTGLGLASVSGIVQQNRGCIAVESERGKGSTFRVFLPRVEEAADAAKAPQPAVRGAGETILVVAGDDALRGMVRRTLARRGYQPLEANSAEAALLVSRNHSGRIDLMITDLVLPRRCGAELRDELARLRPETKVLFMTGYPRDVDGELLRKPFEPEVLARKVRDLLDG